MTIINDKCELFGEPKNTHLDPNKLLLQPERLNPEAINVFESFFPPPWNINEYPEKTIGWIEYQREMRKDPKYYGCDSLNSENK
jgi:hypothetical protein